MELTKSVLLDKINQLRVAYMPSKRKPSLIIMSSEDVIVQATSAEVTDNNQRPKESELIYFQMMLKTLLNPAIQIYRPQAYLDCRILYDQHNIVLKMSTEDITLGAIMGISCGNADRNWLARRKLNLVDADINAWICLVNLPEHLMLTK